MIITKYLSKDIQQQTERVLIIYSEKYVDNMNATININEKYKDGFELQMRF